MSIAEEVRTRSDAPGSGDPAFDRSPPQDIAAEQSVLGGMLLSKEAIPEVVEIVQGSDFYRPAHEVLFDAIVELFGRNEPTDPVTVAAELTKRGELSRVGGPAYLHTLISSVPTAANAGYYAQIVAERAALRRLVAAGTRIVQMGYAADGGDPAELFAAATVELEAASARLHGQSTDDAFSAVEEALNQLETGVPAYSTGLPDLDDIIRGWVPHTLTIFGARPRIGKSAFGLQAALHVALNLGFPVGFTTLEMPRAELMQRAMSNLGKVDYARMQRSPDEPLTKSEWDRINAAAGRLSTPLLHVSDRGEATVASVAHDIRAHTKRMGMPPALWVVDYLQKMKAPRASKSETREQQVAGISAGLKSVALKTGVPILALAQVGRGSEQRSDKKPTLADLRESGGLEADADRVILAHREPDPDKGDPTELYLLVEKNRQGRQGSVVQEFLGQFQLIQRARWSPSATLRGAS